MAPARPAAIPVRRLARTGDRRRGAASRGSDRSRSRLPGRRMDLAKRRCRSPGHRGRLGGPEAVPLQRAPSGGASAREVRPAPRLCARAADAPARAPSTTSAAGRTSRSGRARSRSAWSTRRGSESGPTGTRALADVRRHDLAEASRRGRRRRDPLRLQDEEQRARPPHAAERSPCTGAGAPRRARRITALQVRAGRRARRAHRARLNDTSASGSGTGSPRKISALGAGRSLRRASSRDTARAESEQDASGCSAS